MAPRFKRKKCLNCPDRQYKAKEAPSITYVIAEGTQGARLWRHVLVGTSTCVSMIENYADLDMPGSPADGLRDIRDRLQAVIDKYELS